MTIDREELIEKGVKAMQDADIRDMGYGMICLDDYNARIAVEAVLKAIGEYLPDADFADSSTLEASRLAVIYRQFKNLCEGK